MSTICQLYDKVFLWYEANRDKGLIEKNYLDYILKLIPLNNEILDLGCGTAEPIAKYLIDSGYQITGIDGSSNMIELCQKKFPNQTWIKQDMRNLNLEKKFSAIIAWDSFFHLSREDQRKIFPLFKAHLNFDGILIFTSGHQDAEAWGEIDGNKLFHSSLSTAEYQSILNKLNFEILNHTIEDPACGKHTVWVAQLK